MKKYVCSVCGYVYDEAKGIPEAGILPGTEWDVLPDGWVCPLCGAEKSEFRVDGDTAPQVKPVLKPLLQEDIKELSALEMSALCSNLAKGCEKQYKPEEQAMFLELSDYFKGISDVPENPELHQLLTLIEQDLAEGYPAANAVSSRENDRGTLRALVWSEKVTRILKSVLSRYEKEGDGMLRNTGVYVCTICGFLYVGDDLPEICPVCKVPSWKFEKIEGRQ